MPFPSNSPFHNENKKESAISQRDLDRIYQDLSDIYSKLEHRFGRYDEITSAVADVRDDVYALLK